MNSSIKKKQIEKLSVIISKVCDIDSSQDKRILMDRVGVYESNLCVEVTWVGP